MTEIKRRAKRLFAGLLGLLMALSLLSTTAFAADSSASITVNMSGITTVPQEGLKQIQVTPYLVLDQVNDTETDATKKQYEVTQAFKLFFDHQDKSAPEEGFTSGLDTIFKTVAAESKVYLTYNETEKKLVASASAPENSETKYIEVSGGALDQTYPEAELLSRIQENGAKSILYSWIEKYIKAANVPEATPATKDNNGTNITISGLNEGYYALLFANAPDGVSVIQGILIPTKSPEGAEIDLKAEQLPLNKQVINAQHGEAFDDSPAYTGNKETSGDIGDTLTYQILTKVPTLADSENLTAFVLSDAMENQQLTDTMTLTLTKDGNKAEFTAPLPANPDEPTYFAKPGDNTLKIAKLTVYAYGQDSDGVKKQKFKVDFLPMTTGDPSVVEDAITDPLTNYQGYDVKLIYSAELTTDAVQVNDNDVTLDYTNNGDDSQQTDHTEVYTYGIDVQKTFSDGNTSAENYNAVTFSLYTDEAYRVTEGTKTPMNLYGSAGSYTTDGTTQAQTVLNLSTAGKLTITGLDEGTYWLVETHTADGYSVSDDIKIVLAADSTDKGKLSENNTTAQLGGTGNNLATVANDTGSISLAKFDVLNQKGFNLPQTGGAGTWMFTIGGILLVAAAGVLFAFSRKKDSSK